MGEVRKVGREGKRGVVGYGRGRGYWYVVEGWDLWYRLRHMRIVACKIFLYVQFRGIRKAKGLVV